MRVKSVSSSWLPQEGRDRNWCGSSVELVLFFSCSVFWPLKSSPMIHSGPWLDHTLWSLSCHLRHLLPRDSIHSCVLANMASHLPCAGAALCLCPWAVAGSVPDSPQWRWLDWGWFNPGLGCQVKRIPKCLPEASWKKLLMFWRSFTLGWHFQSCPAAALWRIDSVRRKRWLETRNSPVVTLLLPRTAGDVLGKNMFPFFKNGY